MYQPKLPRQLGTSLAYSTISAACVPRGHLLQVQVMLEDVQHFIVNGAGAMHAEQLLAPGGDGRQDNIVMSDTFLMRKVCAVSIRFGECCPVGILLEQAGMNHLHLTVAYKWFNRGELCRLQSCPCLWLSQMLGAGIRAAIRIDPFDEKANGGSLQQHRHKDDGKRRDQDQITPGQGFWKRQCNREGDHAAHARPTRYGRGSPIQRHVPAAG